MERLIGSSFREDGNEWLSVSDLMAGLMVIFLFIAIIFIRPLTEENRELQQLQSQLEAKSLELESQNSRIEHIAVEWREREENIFKALLEEFRRDLPRWNAEIEKETLLVRFKSPDVLFKPGNSTIEPEFASVLNDFFPRYAQVLKPFIRSIEELRIEGHTSSEWDQLPADQAYIENMRLSQDRTRAVLEYVLSLNKLAENRPWVQDLLTSNGLSSSRLVLTQVGVENPEASRRVEFRVRTTTRSDIARILDVAQ